MNMMRKGALLFVAIVLLLASRSAQAQSFCGNCDPYGSCSVSCWYCTELVDPQYGACPEYAYVVTTCGDFLGACTPDNCTPNWQTTDYEEVGFYGETTYGWHYHDWHWWPTWGCEHHVVGRVTQTDANQCNTSSYYWERQYCNDYVDFSIEQSWEHIPNCCAYPHYCNDWHSCF